MKLHELKPALGSITKAKRIGRGGCRGGTSTRGHNGAKSRSGYKSKRGFEGGQRPLQQRIPKFGFKNFTRVEFKPINLVLIDKLVQVYGVSLVNEEVLVKHGLVKKNTKYKILGSGNVPAGLSIFGFAFSAQAKQKIEACGSKALLVENSLDFLKGKDDSFA